MEIKKTSISKYKIRKLEDKLLIKNALTKMALILNRNKVNWGLGGSLLLYLYGIETTVSDIDIVIDEKDLNIMEIIVENFDHIEKPRSIQYLTKKFYSITLEGIDVDLMIGFKIKTQENIYSYPTEDRIKDKIISIDNVDINLCSIDDWYNAYIAMQRDSKVKLIEQSKLVN